MKPTDFNTGDWVRVTLLTNGYVRTCRCCGTDQKEVVLQIVGMAEGGYVVLHIPSKWNGIIERHHGLKSGDFNYYKVDRSLIGSSNDDQGTGNFIIMSIDYLLGKAPKPCCIVCSQHRSARK